MRNEVSALRTAAERIMAMRSHWDGVGLFVIENLDTGAVGMTLVPADATPPDWSQELLDGSPGFDRAEDQQLAFSLGRRWYRHLADALPDTRWGALSNLLKLHVPPALVAAMPGATRRLACGHGFGVHALPPDPDADPLLGRLVAWLLPWERLEPDAVPPICAYWVPRRGVSRTWTAEALHGAGGRTRDERVAAGGMIQWGVLACWPSAIDAVTAFLLAQAEALEAMPGKGAPAVPAPVSARGERKDGPLNQAQRRLVALAVMARRVPAIAREEVQATQCASAVAWIGKHREDHVPADELRSLRFEGLPPAWLDLAAQQYPAGVALADLAGWNSKLTGRQFRNDIAKALAACRAPRAPRAPS
jgi:hypothetical protein